MRKMIGLLVIGALPLVSVSLLRAANTPPEWAYGIAPAPAGGAAARPAAPAEPKEDPNELHQVPGSTQKFTIAQVENSAAPADWFPEDHPPMPDVVAKGRPGSGVRACSYCHMPNGKGRPSNGPTAGLPVSYFLQQLHDFKSGLRTHAEKRKANVNQMIAIAKAMTPEEMEAAAMYFGSMKWTPWIRVVESATVPKTRAQGNIFYTLPGNQTEPIGTRILEVPENNEQTEPLRNPRSGFVAYVPPGSIKKGEALVTTGGNGHTVACGVCHGPDLRGMGPVPHLAGRSPSYLVRQMYDMQAGTRHGEWSALMKPVVEKLTEEDFVNIAAYVSSRKP
jgi:cytochrome c553